MSTYRDDYATGTFGAILGSLHFPATQAVSFANRLQSVSAGSIMNTNDARSALQECERLEQAAASIRATIAEKQREPHLRLVAAE